MTSVGPAPDKPPPAAGYHQTQYGMHGTPTTRQPGARGAHRREARQVVWMERPELIPGCPPGLEYLTLVDQILVEQEIETFEVITGWEKKNKYRINNNQGQQCYFAQEESDTCQRQCAGPGRGFVMHITDNMGQEVIRVTREFGYCRGNPCCACADCCAFEVSVEAPVGSTVGYVRQLQSWWVPRFSIMDASRQRILSAEGPGCICECMCCAKDQEFFVRSPDGKHEVGKIRKEYGGLVKEMFTDADKFGVSFPMDLDVKMKAVMIGAVFLIDFMFFETNQ